MIGIVRFGIHIIGLRRLSGDKDTNYIVQQSTLSENITKKLAKPFAEFPRESLYLQAGRIGRDTQRLKKEALSHAR
jgi:hypothetical protein